MPRTPMNTQDKDLMGKYGEAIFFTHLIEDILELLLKDAAHFELNGYHSSRRKIEKMKFEERILEFGRAFPDASDEVRKLDLLRRIRNKFAHAMISQVGSDFRTGEGRDQIHAMLSRFVVHAAGQQKLLGKRYESLVKNVVKTDIRHVMNRPDTALNARVADSEIETLLSELDK